MLVAPVPNALPKMTSSSSSVRSISTCAVIKVERGSLLISEIRSSSFSAGSERALEVPGRFKHAEDLPFGQAGVDVDVVRAERIVVLARQIELAQAVGRHAVGIGVGVEQGQGVDAVRGRFDRGAGGVVEEEVVEHNGVGGARRADDGEGRQQSEQGGAVGDHRAAHHRGIGCCCLAKRGGESQAAWRGPQAGTRPSSVRARRPRGSRRRRRRWRR